MLLPHRFWPLQITDWSVLAVCQIAIRAFGFQSFGNAVLMTLVMEPAGFLLTLGLRRYYRRYFNDVAISGGVILKAAMASLLVTLMMMVVWVVCGLTIGWGNTFIANPRLSVIPFVYYQLIFLGWSFLYLWLRAARRGNEEYRRAITAESDVLRTELKFLRAQLDPHFLTNVLNGIVALIPEKPQVAQEMVRNVAGYLRYSLDHGEEKTVPLSEEIKVTQAYLALSAQRFGDNLRYDIKVEPTALDSFVPGYVLQPLVENAIKHGREQKDGLCEVKITAKPTPNGVTLLVMNHGQLEQGWENTARGIGVKNVQRRLELLYPGRHKFSLRQAGSYVCAELSMEGTPCCE